MSKPRTGAPKRVAVGLLAGALAMFGVALAPSAGATTTVTTQRLAGATRYGTAAAIAGDASFGTPSTAIVATGENFPDALAASTLAGVNAPAPIILTQTNTYTTEAKAGLAALKAKGVTAVSIVGGTSAVSTTVENAIKADGFTVTRVAGTDRYATAAAIATAANSKSAAAPVGGLKTALIATGTNFPDALAGGAAAYANKLPLLLVGTTVPQATKDAITALGIKKAVVLGGTAAVSDAVAADLATQTGNTVQRLAGTNRFGTAAAVGDYEISTLGFPATSAVLATGNNFPDALAAGPLAGQNKAPIVLTASLPAESQAFLDAHSNTISKLFVAGGTAAIDDATVTAAQTAAQNTSNDTKNGVTSRPELVAAKVVSTTTSGVQAGTVVRYTFDSAVVAGTATATSFFVVNGSTSSRTAGSTVASVSGDANSVDVNFAGITSAATAGGLTVATVDFNAAKDATGAGSPEGNAALGTSSSTPLTAGTTTAPDLTSVQNFRQATTTLTFVDFVFDQAATVTNVAGFHLVSLAGTNATTVNCTYDNGSTTATIAVTCPNVTAGVPLTSAGYARGYVDASSVSSATGTAAAYQAAADVSNSGNTGTPDLVSATVTVNAAANDTVDLVFDQAVTTQTIGAFHVYSATGTDLGTPASTTTSTSTPNSVRLNYTGGSLTSAVGAFITDGAVIAVGGSNPGAANEEDEVGATNAFSSTTAAGQTKDPDLVSVKRTAGVDVFGTPTGGFTVTYTFDEAITAAVTAGNFHLYMADGTRLNGATCARTTIVAPATTSSSVACTAYTIDVLGSAAANAQVQNAVLGTVDNSAVVANDDAAPNSAEGAQTVS